MTKIVAIGGGEVSAKSTLEIDKEIIAFSGKKNPKESNKKRDRN